jgi:MFS family permease
MMSNTDYVEMDINGRRLSPNYKWFLVAMLWFITFFNYADRMALNANLKLIGDMFKLDDMWKGLLSSAFGYSYGLAAIFAGYIVDRVRRRNAVLFGLCIWSFICILISSAQGFWMLFIFLALEGLGEAFYFPAAMSLISDYHGKRTRSRAMGINQTAVYIGTIAGTCFAALLAAQFAKHFPQHAANGWRIPFVVFGGLGVFLGLVLWRFLYEPKRGAADLLDAGETKKESHRKIGWGEFFTLFFTTPTAVLLLLGFFCANCVAVIVMSWMPTYILETFYKNETQGLLLAGLIATLPIQLASMVAAPAAGLAADKARAKTSSGRVLVQFVGVLAAVPFVFMAGKAETAMSIFVLLAFWGLCKGIYDSNIFASVYDVIRPEARGMAAGLMNLVAWAGAGVLAPPLFGKIAMSIGKRTTVTYLSGLYLVAAILLFIAIAFFVKRDAARMQAQLKAEAE